MTASIVGKTVEYAYENGDSYRVALATDGATWTALAGSAAGSSGTEDYDCVEVAPNVFMVAWLEDTAEVVALVLNLDQRTVYCSYVYGSERHFCQGQITSVS